MHSTLRLSRMLAVLTAAAALLAPLASAMAGDASSGGSSNATSGSGFSCSSGMTYKMVNGMASCQSASPTSTTAASCSSTTVTNGSCSYTFPTTTSGSTAVVSNTVSGYSGTGTATCSAGSWSGLSSVSCAANPCSAATHTDGSCSYTSSALSSGSSSTVSNSTSGYTGSSTATCTAGTLSWAGDTCAVVMQPCASASASWGSGCTGTVSAADNGSSVTVTNTTAYYSGSAVYTCSNGSWVGPTSTSCTAPTCPTPTPAGSQTVGCDTGYTGTGTVQSRSTECDASTGWVWVVGAWNTVSTDCSVQASVASSAAVLSVYALNHTLTSTGITWDGEKKQGGTCTWYGRNGVYVQSALGSLPPITVTVENTSTTSGAGLQFLALPTIAAGTTASDATHFTVTSDTCSTSTVLAPSATCTFVVTPSSASSKTFSALLSIKTNVGNLSAPLSLGLCSVSDI